MVKKIKKQGYPVRTYEEYSNMENYKTVDSFLKEAQKGNKGSIVIYEVHSDGSIGREKFIYDGDYMFLVASNGVWDDNNNPGMAYVSYTRLKKWRYSNKGWFCYELCVPEYPEVTEMVDGSCLVRIKPISSRKRELSKKCVRELGYQGNNLLCSNWDKNHTKKIDFNGLYEYLYAMKYKKKFNGKKYPNGIPKEQFEQLIMEYMPVSAEEIQKYAVYNKNEQIRFASTSGGIFSCIASYLINQKKAIVFGAAYDENFHIRHIAVDNVEDLAKLRGSKYAQSNLGDTFVKIKKLLQEGKVVFFSGTPCQVAGLKKYLKLDYRNLYCLDFICHGVASPETWNAYVEDLKNKGEIQNCANAKGYSAGRSGKKDRKTTALERKTSQ